MPGTMFLDLIMRSSQFVRKISRVFFPTVRCVAYLTWASVNGCVWKKVLVNLLFIIVPFDFWIFMINQNVNFFFLELMTHSWVFVSTCFVYLVPVFKKGDRGSVENYSPISLTSVTSKILEHIVHSSIMDHLDKHSSLNPFQHGFRQKRSCETQLVTTVRDFADCLNRKGQILWHANTGPILAYRNSTGKSMVILAGR